MQFEEKVGTCHKRKKEWGMRPPNPHEKVEGLESLLVRYFFAKCVGAAREDSDIIKNLSKPIKKGN